MGNLNMLIPEPSLISGDHQVFLAPSTPSVAVANGPGLAPLELALKNH